MPTMFTRGASAPVDSAEAPLVMYAARGQGATWEAEHIVNPEAISPLLGRTSHLDPLPWHLLQCSDHASFTTSFSHTNIHSRLTGSGCVPGSLYGTFGISPATRQNRAEQPRNPSPPGMRRFYVSDNNGNRLEFLSPEGQC